MPDKELVEKAKGGDQGAFEQLVLLNQNKVYAPVSYTHLTLPTILLV